VTHVDEKSTAGGSADGDKREKSSTTSNPTDSQETIEAAESAVTDSEPYPSFIKLVKIVDLSRRRTMGKNPSAMSNGAGVKKKAHVEKSLTAWRISGVWEQRQGAVKPVAAVGSKVAVTQPAEASMYAPPQPLDNTLAQKVDNDGHQSH